MAGERTLPGLGLRAFYTDGSSGWGTNVSEDLRKASALIQCRVISRTTALPGSPTDGDMYVIPTGETDAEDIAIRDNGAWVNFTPEEGFFVYVEDEDIFIEFNGTNWVLMAGPIVVTDATTARTLTDADFNGRTIIDFTSGSPITVSLNNGLSPAGICFLRQSGAGQITIAGTATKQSLGGILTSRGQYSMISLTPISTNTYHAEGVSAA